MTGGKLIDRMKYSDFGGKLPESYAKPNVNKILKALLHCHSHNVIHENIKPQNIMFDQYENPKLTDFGRSKNSLVGNRIKFDLMSSNSFMAPEVIECLEDDDEYGKECDVWSLGIMLHYLLTGSTPFKTFNIHTLYGQILN